MSNHKHFVMCSDCDHEFEVDAIQEAGNDIQCPDCNYHHTVDIDVGDDGEYFWYLAYSKLNLYRENI